MRQCPVPDFSHNNTIPELNIHSHVCIFLLLEIANGGKVDFYVDKRLHSQENERKPIVYRSRGSQGRGGERVCGKGKVARLSKGRGRSQEGRVIRSQRQEREARGGKPKGGEEAKSKEVPLHFIV